MRCTIRDLLWLLLVIGLSLGWWLREVQIGEQLVDGKRWKASAEELAKFATTEAGWEVDWVHGSVYIGNAADGKGGGYYIFDEVAFERARAERVKRDGHSPSELNNVPTGDETVPVQ